MSKLGIIFIFLTSWSYADSSIEARLRQFHQNPSLVMDQLPEVVVGGKPIFRGFIDYDEIEKYSEEKNILRSRIQNGSAMYKPWVVFADPDDPKALVENGDIIKNIYQLDGLGLARFFLPVEKSPWADSYWPMYKGIIGARYADPGFPKSNDWGENYAYIMSRPATGILASGDRGAVNNLSPAEKYDLLVGDSNLTLTRYAWNQGKRYFDRRGKVAKWMGICHGWSAAAHMLMPNITAPVTLRTQGGRAITFYQSDIKALNSMLWANASPLTRFIGQRCKKGRPVRNNIGRVIDPICYDNNPGTFYLALVNQMGRHKRSFVIDTTYDLQVWNFAVAGYATTYFNPQSLVPSVQVGKAIVPIEKFTVDKFKEFRSSSTKYVIGVVLDVTHVAASMPSHRISKKEPTKTLRYYLDLELDAGYNIIGGEWYQNAHPDFTWSYDVKAQAMGRGEYTIDPNEWQLENSIPETWTLAAQKASSYGAPLWAVIKKIVQSQAVGEPGEEGDAVEEEIPNDEPDDASDSNPPVPEAPEPMDPNDPTTPPVPTPEEPPTEPGTGRR